MFYYGIEKQFNNLVIEWTYLVLFGNIMSWLSLSVYVCVPITQFGTVVNKAVSPAKNQVCSKFISHMFLFVYTFLYKVTYVPLL